MASGTVVPDTGGAPAAAGTTDFDDANGLPDGGPYRHGVLFEDDLYAGFASN
jgi:hypothetical protein